MNTIRLALDQLARAAAVLASAAMVLMLLHIMVDVVSDFVFDRPLDGTTEITSYYYMVALVFLAFPYVQRHRGHLFVEVFTGWMQPRHQRLLDALGQVLLFAFLVLLAWLTSEEALRRTASNEMVEAGITPVVVWPSRWLLPVGAALMALVALAQALTTLTGGAWRGASPDEAEPHGDPT